MKGGDNEAEKINLEDDFEDLDPNPAPAAKNETPKQNDDFGDFEDLEPNAPAAM